MLKRRDGFTLVELLIVVVIIGILAAIALPKLTGTREGAYFSTATSDLRNLANALEVDYSRNDFEYPAAIAGITDLFEPSVNVTIAYTVSASNQGWSATATHASITTNAGPHCAVFVGDAAAVAPATQEGVVACDRS